MIFKYELAEAINYLSHDLTLLSIKVKDLEDEVKKLKTKTCKCPKKCTKKAEPKRKPGRPRKNEKKTAPKRKVGRPRKA